MKSMKRSNRIFQTVLLIVFSVMCALVLYPFLLLIGISFSDERDVAIYGYELIPRHFSFESYKYIFRYPESIITAYKTTIIFSVLGTFLSVLCIAMFAYPLSRKDLPGRKAVSFYLYFTMLFGGGLVPTYILNTQYLHLGDTIWIYIVPSLVGAYSVFMMRAFFQGLPEEMFESMIIDGASHYNIFFKTVIPLSKPVIATVAVTTFLGKWNNWYTSMIYINKEDLISLQYFLQRIMKNIELLETLQESGMTLGLDNAPSETARMAMAVIVAGPAILVFPFFQKYFVRGLTVGSVKG